MDSAREEFMAWKLKQLMSTGKQILFVCGAAHWEPIRALLTRDLSSYEPPASSGEEGELMCSGRFSILRAGDEIPALVTEYERFREEGREVEFNAFLAFEDLKVSIRKALGRVEGISLAEILTFEEYLTRLCRETGVLTPRIFHLDEAARSCLGPNGAKAVWQHATRFSGCPKGVPKLEGAIFARNGLGARFQDKSVMLTSRSQKIDGFYDRQTCSISWGSGQSISSDSQPDLRYALGDWEVHMKRMMLEARRRAQAKYRAVDTSEIRDRLIGSLDVRATIRARIAGTRRLYQKEERVLPLNSMNEFEGFDPIVWCFERNFKKDIEYLVLDDKTADLVIGVAATPRIFHEGTYSCNFELLASFIPRFADTDPTMMNRIKRWIAQGNERFIPTVSKFWEIKNNPRWSDASKLEKVLLLALDYCREYVVCVSEHEPSRRVTEAFRKSGKKVLHAPLSTFASDDIQILRTPEFSARTGMVN